MTETAEKCVLLLGVTDGQPDPKTVAIVNLADVVPLADSEDPIVVYNADRWWNVGEFDSYREAHAALKAGGHV